MSRVPSGLAAVGSQSSNIAGLAGGPVAASLKLFEDALDTATSGMRSWVEALSPATVDQLNRAMGELFATLGQALLPVIEVMTDVIRRVADVISPLMQQLAPIFRQLAEIVGVVLLGAVNALVGVITGLLSVFGDVEGGLKGLKEQMAAFVAMMIRGLAYLVKEFGGMRAVAKWREMITGGVRAMPAPADAAIKALPQISSDIATRAFMPQGQKGHAETMEQLQQQIRDDLREIANNGLTFRDWLKGEFLEALKKALQAVIENFKTVGRGAAAGARVGGGPGVLGLEWILENWFDIR